MKHTAQLSLSVQLPDDETFLSFHQSHGQHIVNHIQSFIDCLLANKAHPTAFYLFGINGVGKSHLLHASCAYAEQCGLTSVSISFEQLSTLSIQMFEGLENIDVICLDDIHLIAGDAFFERAVFDLYNKVTESGKCLIISGNQSVNQLPIKLPDLLSRLSWGLTEQIKPINDDEKIIALQQRAENRGLLLSIDSAKFMLNRLSREMNYLIGALDELDKASMREQRKITIPFIKQIFPNISV